MSESCELISYSCIILDDIIPFLCVTR